MSSSYDDYSEWSEDPFLLYFNKLREDNREKERLKQEEKAEQERQDQEMKAFEQLYSQKQTSNISGVGETGVGFSATFHAPSHHVATVGPTTVGIAGAHHGFVPQPAPYQFK